MRTAALAAALLFILSPILTTAQQPTVPADAIGYVPVPRPSVAAHGDVATPRSERVWPVRPVPTRPVAPIPTPRLIVVTVPTARPRALEPSGHHASGVAVREGVASRMGSGFGRSYLALPEGPGHRVRICAARCWTMRSTDAGPDKAMQRAGRIADLNDWVWHYVTGLPLSRGLARVTVEYL